MDAIEKTKKLERRDLPLHRLIPNAKNPNKMSSRAFDLLCDNIQKTGLTDPILVRPAPEETKAGDDPKYRIVGGHHRFDAASFLGFDEVPVTVINDPAFDEEAENFQLVRMNMIKGKLDPQAFFGLYQQLADKYSDEILQDAFGFADEAEFQKLVNSMAKALPDKQMQEKFKEAAADIKTIDGLSKLLNDLFTRYGDTLPYGFMCLDYGGHDSIWLRVEGKTMKAARVMGDICIDNRRTMDDLFGRLLQLIAKGDCKDLLDRLIAETPEAKLPKGLSVLPTKEHIKAVSDL